MIRLLLIINSILLTNSLEASWFGKYNSRLDARSACESWQSKGFLYKYDVIKDVGYLEQTFMGEGLNTKTTVSLVLASILTCIQVFWK